MSGTIGLCSVTFRDKEVTEILQLMRRAGIGVVEWGGDRHVPPDNQTWASEVQRLTKESGIRIASYGSYYRLGQSNSFKPILETALCLKAPSIRVWAGNVASNHTTYLERNLIVQDAIKVATYAAYYGITIHIEYHDHTLTDTAESAALLMKEINHPNVRLYWQPALNLTVEQKLASIQQTYQWLAHIHVFHWQASQIRKALKEGEAEWFKYLNALLGRDESRYFFLEFVKSDSVDQFLEDARTLKHWLLLATSKTRRKLDC
ncbi:Sugar phosphate isomerase/epimerase [Amphibacillus marinus]|uniref:Sugar phosphate isomerase/epimerase n=1 Tax=Amphibacillus marinus TaxID=872970 RepID=A0A1H8RAW3_9BACI|nr:TIM barrel protein [Amphibacillus marinus]SEO63540.1 Sugar phosphate isomerase/epimerase [Amphibacillus marinus]